MKWFGNTSIEELRKKGFEPIGVPGLLLGILAKVNDGHIEEAIMTVNEEGFEYDSCALYLRTNAQGHEKHNILEVTRKVESDAHYYIAQPLKRIELTE